MTKDKTTALQLTYEEFLTVLSRWDTYMHLEFSEMPRGFPAADSAIKLQSGCCYPPGWADANHTNLSDLAEIIWKSLKSGADDVDRIHDEHFVEAQVEHFKRCYASPEHVASLMEDDCDALEPPEEMFRMLGKPAQMVIVRDELLEKAIEAYWPGKEISRNKHQAMFDYYDDRRREEREKAKVRKRVRELDHDQCVFCGAQVTNNFRYIQISEGDYEPDNVVLSCKSCNSTRKEKWYEEGKAKPVFGRFSALETTMT